MKVMDFAIEMERSERDLYRELAQRAEKKGLRAIFSRMIEDEENILENLRTMAARERDAESLVLDGAKSPFDARSEMEAPPMEDDLQAYQYMIEMERKMRDFYEDAARRESNPSARNLLLRIAAEEDRELQSLEAVYEFVNAPNEYLAWAEFSNMDEFHNFGRYEDNRGCGHTA